MLGSVRSYPIIPRQVSIRFADKRFALAFLGRHKTVASSPLYKAGLSMLNTNYYSEDERKKEDANKVKIKFETSSNTKVMLAEKGEILRTAMLRRGASPHNGKSRLINCRGLGTCGTCAVEIKSDGIDTDAVEPRKRNAKERLRLNFPPHGSDDQSPDLRLACQVQVKGNINVKKRTGFWGQDSEGLAEEYEAELWLGDLEYLLDDKSPHQE